jgi:transposase
MSVIVRDQDRGALRLDHRHDHKFASYNGTAPIDVSSGEQVRHSLSRAGNRRINHALHMVAVTRIRYPDTTGPCPGLHHYRCSLGG